MGLNERLARLESQVTLTSSPGPPPEVSLLLKTMHAARQELDGEEPEPYTLTAEEKAADREGTAWFVRSYIPHLKANESAEHTDAIQQLEELAKAELSRMVAEGD